MAPLSMKNDGCRKIGAVMSGKAVSVTSGAECSRLFGSLWKSQRVTGVIKQVVTPLISTGKQTSLICDWVVGGVTKTRDVKIMSVTLATSSSNALATLHPVESSSTQFPLATLSVASRHNTDNQGSALSERTTASPATHEQARITHHGLHWIARDMRLLLNGAMHRRPWSVSHVTGGRVAKGHSLSGMTPLRYFQWMFPMSHLDTIVSLTNIALSCRNKPATNASEILRYFGFLVLLSGFEFGARRDLCSVTSKTKYVPVANFGRIMPYHRFEMLRCCIRYSSCGESGDMMAPVKDVHLSTTS